jgi:hypothetical protein
VEGEGVGDGVCDGVIIGVEMTAVEVDPVALVGMTVVEADLVELLDRVFPELDDEPEVEVDPNAPVDVAEDNVVSKGPDGRVFPEVEWEPDPPVEVAEGKVVSVAVMGQTVV